MLGERHIKGWAKLVFFASQVWESMVEDCDVFMGCTKFIRQVALALSFNLRIDVRAVLKFEFTAIIGSSFIYAEWPTALALSHLAAGACSYKLT
jgi:hypothetical protein